MKYRHSDEFFDKKWDEFVQYCKDKSIINPFPNKDNYINTYELMQEEGIKQIDRNIKYFAQYKTDYKTALREYQILKELDPDSALKFKNIKSMSTNEFAKMYDTQIDAMYHNLRGNGMNAEDAQSYISTYWFGSD